MTKTFRQIFYIRKSKSAIQKEVTIYLRITVNGIRTEISTQRNCCPAKWNSISGRLNGKTQDVKQINEYLDSIEYRIADIHKDLTLFGHEITGEVVRLKFLGITDKPRMLVEIYEHHNQQFAELVGKEFSEGTLKKFKTCKQSIIDFLQWKNKTSDIAIKKLGFEFVNDYEFYLKTVKNCSHNTAMGYIKKLKKIVRQCVAKNWLDKDPFMAYKMTLRETHRVILTEEELNTIANKTFVTKRMEQVRDIFLFSCFTGLAYSDVEKLTPADITTGIDGEKWIFTTRTKTDTASRIPILPTAAYIIDKYISHPKANNSNKMLPVLSNQRMNSYLKELADVCNLNKELTFHCARHTFATTITLTNGVPIETVGKMLGHKNLRTTQIYAKVLDRKVNDDMKLLRDKLILSKVNTTQVQNVKSN